MTRVPDNLLPDGPVVLGEPEEPPETVEPERDGFLIRPENLSECATCGALPRNCSCEGGGRR